MPQPTPELIGPLLQRTSALHQHLCPRQVLGVRMGLLGAELLALAVPRQDKRMFAVMETDGCGADGVSVATNCWVGRRTMRITDYGKMAATFVDRDTGEAFRVRPHDGARVAAEALAADRWEAMLLAYQRMPDSQLLSWSRVRLRFDLADQISDPGRRVACAACGEEVRNGREVIRGGLPLCIACADGGYYDVVAGAV